VRLSRGARKNHPLWETSTVSLQLQRARRPGQSISAAISAWSSSA